MQTSGMVLLSVHAVSVRIRRITLPQEPFTSTLFSTVSCPAIIVGPSTEKEGLQWKTMKKKRIMTTNLSSLNTVILLWDKLKGKLKKRHMMSPVMILVGPLLMHGETVKLIRRGRSLIAC
jgi:hypothetical protein